MVTGESAELARRRVSAAKNQSLMREVNERIEKLAPSAMYIEFTCECLQISCTAPVFLSVDEYEEVRSVATCFVVLPAHVDEEVERIVTRRERYWVVEKTGSGGGVAARLDPRTRRARPPEQTSRPHAAAS
jgi:hypothetical protein